MASIKFLHALQLQFADAAEEIIEEGQYILVHPEIAGLSVMLTAVVYELQLEDFKIEDVSVEAITKALQHFNWEPEQNITFADIVKLAQYCLPIEIALEDSEADDAEEATSIALEHGEADDTEEAASIAALVDELHERANENEFPIVLPTHCNGAESETEDSAEKTLGMLDKVEHTKIASYIQHQKHTYFTSETFTDASERATAEALWDRRYHYKHLRDCLAKESLETQKCLHRFFSDTFLPLLPPHSIAK